MMKKLQQRIEKFLSVKIDNDPDWPEASQEDLEELGQIFRQIVDAKFSRDCDGDFDRIFYCK